nr:exonuclease subunit SbcD [uncultured Holophaga sp.]
MRILHTSDWHLGATLEELSREPDHRAFLDWLRETLISEAVDVLIIAGDIFDTASPSAEAQGLYYRFLHSLAGTPLRQVVVVGGNHDSAARLDAPRELLGAFGIHVVGGLDGDAERCLCPVLRPDGSAEAVIAAVPFLNEWRLGFRPSEEGDQREALGAPFRAFYAHLADRASERWPGVPLVATGHLAVAGSTKDDAPQEIHLIGTLGGLPTGIFDPRFAYVALGHIHRAYAVGGTQAWYAGSPIALNAKEGRRPRTVNRVDLQAGAPPVVQILEIPCTRLVKEFRGSLETVKTALRGLAWAGPLAPMIKVDLEVETYQVGLEEEVRAFVASLDPRPLLMGITQSQLHRTADQVPSEAPPPRLADLGPREVFRLLCESRGESYEELQEAFESLLALEMQA